MILHFWISKGIYCQEKCSHEIIFICGIFLKRCINLSKFSIWETLIYQFHDLIILINTETKRIMTNKKIQALKDISFLEFKIKIFFKNSSQLRKYCIIIISVDNVIIRNRNIRHSYNREFFDVYRIINCSFIIFQNFNYYIKYQIILLSSWFCSLYSIHELKEKNYHNLD